MCSGKIRGVHASCVFFWVDVSPRNFKFKTEHIKISYMYSKEFVANTFFQVLNVAWVYVSLPLVTAFPMDTSRTNPTRIVPKLN